MKVCARLLLLLFLLACPTSMTFAQEKRFKRVEKFPAGEQTNEWIGSFMSGVKDVNIEEYTFEFPYEKVWGAAVRASESFSKAGGRPVVAVDAAGGRIQNGKVSLDATLGMGATAWMDEFVIEVARLTQNLTKVAVTRKVVEKQISGDRPWKTVWSNGKIERWILTQIEDELANDGIDFQASAPGKYVKEGKKDYLDLKPDGTFRLFRGNKEYFGQYEINGSTLALVQGKHVEHAKMSRNAFVSGDGKRWIKESGSFEAMPAATGEVVGNKDRATKLDKVDYSKSGPGKYVNRDNRQEYFELKPNGTFFLREYGMDLVGTYHIKGNVITGFLPNGISAKAKFRGDTIVDEVGKTWVRVEEIPTAVAMQTSVASAKEASTPSPSTEVLTNADIVRMVEAKLPDSVIIAKIRSSKANFDTTTDGLIKLKASGVSDAVIQVMTVTVAK